MTKHLLSLAAFVALSIPAINADTFDLGLDDLGSGWSSSYDPATHTITYEVDWSGRGWWLGDVDYSAYDEVVIEFEPVDWYIQVVVEYNNGTTSSTSGAEAGGSKIICELDPDGKSSVMQIYLQSSTAGNVTLTAAYLQNAAVFDPTATKVLWEGEQAVDWYEKAVTVSVDEFRRAKVVTGDKLVVDFTTSTGGSLKEMVLNTDWNTVMLPGFAALEGFNTEYETLYFSESGACTVTLSDEDVAILTDKANYQKLMVAGDVVVTKVSIVPAAQTSGITAPVVAEHNGLVNVYDLQGRQLKTAVNASEASHDLAPGIYLVGGKKVLVR